MRLENWIKRANILFKKLKFRESEYIGWEETSEGLTPILKGSIAAQAAAAEGTAYYLCKIDSHAGVGFYNCTIYANGKYETSTGTGLVEVVQSQLDEILPAGTWVMAGKAQITAIGESGP